MASSAVAARVLTLSPRADASDGLPMSAPARMPERDLPDIIEETVAPILVGSALGGTCGILFWMLASARFGVTGWLW